MKKESYNIAGWSIRETFAMYGLDVRKNFLTAPKCDCGECDGKTRLCLDTIDDAMNCCGMILDENKCNHCCICGIPLEGLPFIAIKMLFGEENEPEITFLRLKKDMNRRKVFSELDKNLDFHEIGLIIEEAPGLWRIIED